MIKDIHTHHLKGKPDECILSYFMSDDVEARHAAFTSPGIHPWHLTNKEDFTRQLTWLTDQLSDNRAIAIGEIGLDKVCPVPFALQMECFTTAVQTLAPFGKPFILHCVKATNEMMALKKNVRTSAPWIIHGFRGKKELALSLVNQGFYLSFGERYNSEALKSVPADRLLLETDDSTIPIDQLFERAAACRKITPDELQNQVSQTVERLFFSR